MAAREEANVAALVRRLAAGAEGVDGVGDGVADGGGTGDSMDDVAVGSLVVESAR